MIQFKCMQCQEVMDEDWLIDDTCCYCGSDELWEREVYPTDSEIESMSRAVERHNEVTQLSAFIDRVLK